MWHATPFNPCICEMPQQREGVHRSDPPLAHVLACCRYSSCGADAVALGYSQRQVETELQGDENVKSVAQYTS